MVAKENGRRADSLRANIQLLLLMAVMAFCQIADFAHRQSTVFRELSADILLQQWISIISIAIWCGVFLLLSLDRADWLFTILLLTSIVRYAFGGKDYSVASELVLLFGAAVGKGVSFALQVKSQRLKFEVAHAESRCGRLEVKSLESGVRIFLTGMIIFAAFASWWHLDMSANFYHGPRWMGLWSNPNVYGVLMSASAVLAIGLFVAEGKWNAGDGKLKADDSGRWSEVCRWIKPVVKNSQSAILLVAAGLTGMGLVMSYSRGAWCGTVAALAYMAWSYGRLKWRYVASVAGLGALGILALWGRTADSAPWYIKRMDLARPSAQHRVAAWGGALRIMRDHPFGVGWNRAVEAYAKDYSPPEGGAAAITTNDYLMLGTQLGWPGLICFVSYVGLRLRSPRSIAQGRKSLEKKLEVELEKPKAETARTEMSVQQEIGLERKSKKESADFSQRSFLPFFNLRKSRKIAEIRNRQSEVGTPARGILSRSDFSAPIECGEGKSPSVTVPNPLFVTGHNTPAVVTPITCHSSPEALIRIACRSATLGMAVAFWFDGGLFILATASVFWVLLELGREDFSNMKLL